ncbi:hypothetical protein EV426DRAFT_717254 [Tirmania nivea]|nr:hypothetical protein EV426DRAFT_717254 [Tirmania nivea]
MILAKPSIEGLAMSKMKEKVYRGYWSISTWKDILRNPVLVIKKPKFQAKDEKEYTVGACEKEIISMDEKTGEMEEFIVMDRIQVAEERFVRIIEAKNSSTGEVIKQCLLSLKEAWDYNGQGEVFGFVTTGKHWQMIRYNGKSFVVIEEFTASFRTME